MCPPAGMAKMFSYFYIPLSPQVQRLPRLYVTLHTWPGVLSTRARQATYRKVRSIRSYHSPRGVEILGLPESRKKDALGLAGSNKRRSWAGPQHKRGSQMRIDCRPEKNPNPPRTIPRCACVCVCVPPSGIKIGLQPNKNQHKMCQHLYVATPQRTSPLAAEKCVPLCQRFSSLFISSPVLTSYLWD